MCTEQLLHDNCFRKKQTTYFQKLTLEYLSEMRLLKRGGLFSTTEKNDWRGVVKHQLIVASVTEVLCELLEFPEDKKESLTKIALLYDQDKRGQYENMSMTEIIQEEHCKIGLLRVMGNNFSDFESWGIDEYILRFADSVSDLKIVSWREKMKRFRTEKQEENKMGIPIYGEGTWDRLERVMKKIEESLFKEIVDRSPALAEKYEAPMDLQKLIEDSLTRKISNA